MLLPYAGNIGCREIAPFEQQRLAGPLRKSIRCAVSKVESSGVTALSKAPEGRTSHHELFLIECNRLNRSPLQKQVKVGAGVVAFSPFQNHCRFEHGYR